MLVCSVSANDMAAPPIHVSSWFLASSKALASRNPMSSWRVLSAQRWKTRSKRRPTFCIRLRTSTTSCLVLALNAAVFSDVDDNDEIASRRLSMSCCNSCKQSQTQIAYILRLQFSIKQWPLLLNVEADHCWLKGKQSVHNHCISCEADVLQQHTTQLAQRRDHRKQTKLKFVTTLLELYTPAV